MTGTRQKDSKTTIVQFSPTVKYRGIPRFCDYTGAEHDATWYSNEQLQDILVECYLTCQNMMLGYPVLEEDGFCSRGLEYKTTSGSKFRKSNKIRGWEVVMTECETQKKMGVQEPEYLSMVYSSEAKDCRRLAHLMGICDEEEARTNRSNASPMLRLKKKKPPLPQYITSPVSDSDNSDASLSVDNTVYIVDSKDNDSSTHGTGL
jgi:hypothetical protein